MEVLNIYERGKFPVRNEKLYDVIVIGGGPAGLTAALYLARAGCRTLVLERRGYGGQIALTNEVVNYPGVLTTRGMELTDTMRRQAESFGAEFLIAEAQELSLFDAEKTVKTSAGNFRCLGVLLATGAQPKMAGFRGEEKFRGRGVSYCATCDGMLYRGKRAAVIGLAADAPAEADFLREIGCDVQYYDGKKHRFEIRGAERADTLVVDGAAQPADVIFVLRAGFAADTLLPGIATDKGHIVVDESYAASIPGVFAAGDCTGAPYQIPAAVGEGNRAALSVVRWLRNA